MSDKNVLLRQKDLIEQVGVPKTTLHDWIRSFSAYVPIVMQGRTKYYNEGSVEVLARIRDLRTVGYDKPQISETLAYEFPIDVSEVERKVEAARDPEDARDAVYLAMQTVAEMSEKMEDLVKRQEEQDEKIREQDAEIARQNEELEKHREHVRSSIEDRDKKLNETMTNFIEKNKKRSLWDRIRNKW